MADQELDLHIWAEPETPSVRALFTMAIGDRCLTRAVPKELAVQKLGELLDEMSGRRIDVYLFPEEVELIEDELEDRYPDLVARLRDPENRLGFEASKLHFSLLEDDADPIEDVLRKHGRSP